jgi:hypothetical protein
MGVLLGNKHTLGFGGSGVPRILSKDLQNKFLFIWNGKFLDGKLKNELNSNHILIFNKDFASTFIPNSSTCYLNIPSNIDFINADTDNLWYDGVIKNVIINDLLTVKNSTFVKYNNSSPYDVYMIAILKYGEILTEAEKDELSEVLQLWVNYFGEWNDNGFLKENL